MQAENMQHCSEEQITVWEKEPLRPGMARYMKPTGTRLGFKHHTHPRPCYTLEVFQERVIGFQCQVGSSKRPIGVNEAWRPRHWVLQNPLATWAHYWHRRGSQHSKREGDNLQAALTGSTHTGYVTAGISFSIWHLKDKDGISLSELSWKLKGIQVKSLTHTVNKENAFLIMSIGYKGARSLLQFNIELWLSHGQVLQELLKPFPQTSSKPIWFCEAR